jgi:hypothetical protein
MARNLYLISREFAHARIAAGLVAFPVLIFILCPVICVSTIAAAPSHIGNGVIDFVDTLGSSAASLLPRDYV